MNTAISRIFTPHDRMHYALDRVGKMEVSWSAREFFFLVRTFFPAETRSNVSRAAATLCTKGKFSIRGRRYILKSPKPAKAETVFP